MDEDATVPDLFEIFDALHQLEELNDYQKAFVAIWELESEVNNGGFSLYFSNLAGRNAHEAEAGLQRIGALACAKLLRQATEIFKMPENAWEDEEARQGHIAKISETFEQEIERLDNQFLEYPDDLENLLTSYAKLHAAELNS